MKRTLAVMLFSAMVISLGLRTVHADTGTTTNTTTQTSVTTTPTPPAPGTPPVHHHSTPGQQGTPPTRPTPPARPTPKPPAPRVTLKQACGSDIQQFCPSVQGRGATIKCLMNNVNSLSATCQKKIKPLIVTPEN
jgi:hypothetical protein